MPYAPITLLLIGAGWGPSTSSAAHFSEVTREKRSGVGNRRKKLISYVFSPLHGYPILAFSLPLLLLLSSLLYSKGETTDFLPAPPVCFSKCQRNIHLAFRSPRCGVLLIFLRLFQNVFSLSFLGARPWQTPSGLLLAHSPLLSGIHFWSSLSPVAPLSPARLQGHSSLFQVRSTQVKERAAICWGVFWEASSAHIQNDFCFLKLFFLFC